MSHPLIALSPDLQRLRDEGYDVKIEGAQVVLSNVPYVNGERKLKWGTLRSQLNLAGDKLAKPHPHTVLFSGECCPCDQSGNPMVNLLPGGRNPNNYGTFSRKPQRGHYENYHEQFTTYINLLLTPAQVIDPAATAQGYPVIETTEAESVFHYEDTASSRAGIVAVSRKLALNRVVIIGVGGTGSYILDLVSKTPVRQIDIYDSDTLLNHNAFRAPGAPSIEELRAHPKKVAYLAAQYSRMHRGIKAHTEKIDESNVDALGGADFVFISMDSGEAKRLIIKKLEEFGIAFIDVGMGINLVGESLTGMLRVTTSTKEKRGHVTAMNRISFGEANGDNEYAQNIQTADLNALNAALAVIKWKKLVGFYADMEREFNSTYTINGNLIMNEDK
jgi:hypothetical protein